MINNSEIDKKKLLLFKTLFDYYLKLFKIITKIQYIYYESHI